jgi:hypothetical protein
LFVFWCIERERKEGNYKIRHHEKEIEGKKWKLRPHKDDEEKKVFFFFSLVGVTRSAKEECKV